MNDTDSLATRRLRAVVDDVRPPPGYAATVLRAGRARRRRRQGLVASVAAVLVIGTAGTLAGTGHLLGAEGPDVADGPHATALEWARDLPEGPAAELPYFGTGVLHDGDRTVPVPDEVNLTLPPRRTADGWVVVVGSGWPRLQPAVLALDGSLRRLPAYRFPDDSMDPTVLVSPDGTRVAYGDRVVDLATGEATELAHDPHDGPDPEPNHANTLDLVSWGSHGLIYRGTPVAKGWGTTWLLGDDGSTVHLLDADDPRSVTRGSAASVVLEYDYSRKADTCSTVSRLEGDQWVEEPSHCMGRYLGESLDLSPDGRWVLTDDLPEVWDLVRGEWVEVDLPRSVLEGWGEGWMTRAGWESPDSFLIPIADRWVGWDRVAEPFDQHLQVVRCRMSTGECERAGDELVVRAGDEEPTPMQSDVGVQFSPH